MKISRNPPNRSSGRLRPARAGSGQLGLARAGWPMPPKSRSGRLPGSPVQLAMGTPNILHTFQRRYYFYPNSDLKRLDDLHENGVLKVSH